MNRCFIIFQINVNNKSKTEEADKKFDEMREEMIGDVKKEKKTVKNTQVNSRL